MSRPTPTTLQYASAAATAGTPPVSVPSEFDIELRSERLRWLRRRLLWLCAVGVALTVVFDVPSIVNQFGQASGPADAAAHGRAGWIDLAECSVNVLLYAGAWLVGRRGRWTERSLLRLVFWLVVGVAAVELVFQRWRAGVLSEPDVAADPRLAAALISMISGLMVLASDHFLACAFMPWTAGESLRPAGVLLGMFAVPVITDVYLGTLPVVALSAVAVLALTFIPGTLICLWRTSRFREGFRLRFESGRYRALQGELAAARRLHEASLPAQRDLGPVRLHYAYEPMRQIGGDLLHVHAPPGEPGVLSAVVLDVTGHGIAAALTVNRLIGELERLFAESPDAPPDAVLLGLNRYVALTLSRHTIYATALCVRLNTRARTLEWASGGHPPAFVRRPNGQLEALDTTGPLLGLDEEHGGLFETCGKTVMGAGDVLVAYTDGLCEAANPAGEQLGTDGVRRLISEVSADGKSPRGWPRAMLNGVLNYRQSPVEDDTLVVALYAG